MKEKTDYGDDLKRRGLKNTKHRTAILDILERSNQPIAVEQIFLELNEKEIPVSLSTVYRVLDSLVLKNLVIKLTISGDNRALFEYNRMMHRHYLVCLSCKKIIPINHCPLGDYEKSLEKETGFTIAGHKLDIYGYCSACKEKKLDGKM